MSFFDDRYSVVVPEFTMYISPDLSVADVRYHELTGGSSMFDAGWEGGFVTHTLEEGLLAFVAGIAVAESRFDVELRDVLAHEYGHLLQFNILRSAGVSRASAWWMTEGTAEYNAELYREHYTGSAVDRSDRLVGLNSLGPFRDVVQIRSIVHYDIAALAVDWLERHSETPGANLEYWRLLVDSPTWADAFETAFGITVEDFFEAFEEHRSELAAVAPRVRGTVTDLAGSKLGSVHVMASARGNAGPHLTGLTAEDGTFDIPVPPGDYFIVLGRAAHATPGKPHLSRFFDLTYNAETGYANSCGPYHPISVGGLGVSDLVIRIKPDLLVRVDEPPCNEGIPGYFVIESRVFGPDGEPLAGDLRTRDGIYVEPTPLRASRSSGFVNASGVSRVAVPAGSYVLEIEDTIFGQQSRHVGWYGGETGFTTDLAQATVIEIAEADVTDIEIHLPADPADLPTIE